MGKILASKIGFVRGPCRRARVKILSTGKFLPGV